ncbi:MAG: hypothetical protein ACOYBY_14845 [Dermatophilaceae bacterium]
MGVHEGNALLLRDVDADHGAPHTAGEHLQARGRLEQLAGPDQRLLDHLAAQPARHDPSGPDPTCRRSLLGPVPHASRERDGRQPPRGDHGLGILRHDHPHVVPGRLQAQTERGIRLHAAPGVHRDDPDPHASP